MKFNEYIEILDTARERLATFQVFDEKATYIPEANENYQGNDLMYWVAVTTKEKYDQYSRSV